jgi:TRAP-type mannitol/chloroaromatic compound transport system substrate-binding protein
MIEVAASELNANMATEFHAQNIQALQKLKSLSVQLAQFPNDVTEAGKKGLREVIEEFSRQNNDFAKVYDSIDSYLKLSKEWSDASLGYFLNIR